MLKCIVHQLYAARRRKFEAETGKPFEVPDWNDPDQERMDLTDLQHMYEDAQDLYKGKPDDNPFHKHSFDELDGLQAGTIRYKMAMPKPGSGSGQEQRKAPLMDKVADVMIRIWEDQYREFKPKLDAKAIKISGVKGE